MAELFEIKIPVGTQINIGLGLRRIRPHRIGRGPGKWGDASMVEEVPPLKDGEHIGVANATGEIHVISKTSGGRDCKAPGFARDGCA